MGVLDGFESTWSNARSTFGQGTPQDGAQLDGSGQLREMQSKVESAKPDARWTGSASDSYAAANDKQARVLGQAAELDQRLRTEVERSAQVVSAGRQNLDIIKTFTSAAALILTIMLAAGCTSDTSDRGDSGPAGWPQGFEDLTVVWSGESGIDLVTGPAVVVRAYLESFLLGELTGEEKYFYPGFAEAVGEEWRPRDSSPAPRPWVGTERNHLLSLKRSDSVVTAIGCMYTYSAASPHGEGDQGQGDYESQAVPPGAPEAGIAAIKVTLSAPSEYSGPEEPQKGPARTPVNDVFGGYKVTGYWGGYFSAKGSDRNWPERQQSTDECIAKAPDPFERRKFLTSNYSPRGDFPTLPATPGWPAKQAS